MAYLKELRNSCERCHRPAKVELFGRQNASYGKFCLTHGNQRLRELAAEEHKVFEAMTGGAK